MTNLVPPQTILAAKRGFIRTSAQAYAATIPTGGISVGALTAVIDNPDPVIIVATAIAALVSPLLAGAASYLSIISKGIPEDYQAA